MKPPCVAQRPRLSFLPVRWNRKLWRDASFHWLNGYLLHIFNANNPYDPATGQGDRNAGQELLAYLPNSVLKNTVALTSPTYRHRYYVDGSPTAGDVFLPNRGGWRTVAVGGLGAGGQGYFALDIT